jgi:hypothetical protein
VARKALRKAVDAPEGIRLAGSDHLCFAMYHCGARILNIHRPLERQLRDWERVGRAIPRL